MRAKLVRVIARELSLDELIYALLLLRRYDLVQELIERETRSGTIGREDYGRLVEEIARLMLLEGEEFRRKAREIAEKIARLTREREQLIDVEKCLLEERYDVIHDLLNELRDSRKISSEDYGRLVEEIARLMLLEGEEFRRKAREISRVLTRYLR